MTGRKPRFKLLAALTALAVAVLLSSTALVVVAPWKSTPTHKANVDPAHPDWSVARRWDEALLDAIRRALPNPPVHARNLFHVSVAMYDAWAAYDPTATGYIANEKDAASDVAAARDEAISYAAYRVLTERYIKAVGASDSLSEFDNLMDALGYPIGSETTDGGTPSAVGNRIAKKIIAYGLQDGSNEQGGYADPSYKPVNSPLVVKATGPVAMTDPNRWQPLQIEHMISQNGIPVTNGTQQAVGPGWGFTESFGMPSGGSTGVPIDPGPPPKLGDPATDQELKDEIVEVIRDSSLLDPAANATIDISPSARGNNDLGTNDGKGRPTNPSTGKAYAANVVNEADFGRVMAEFWADGPKSETPPGHWNVLANDASDLLGTNLRIGGTGPVLGRLEWDVKMYFVLNAAVHDAACAAWGLKGYYDSSRPISLIRYMATLGQSTDPSGPSYNKEGLPLVPGLIEVITAESSGPGQRHETLAAHVGEIAVRSWTGNPADPKTQVGGVKWILGTAWVPYQLPTFVTPAFPAYASGHSSFSRAAAEVMVAFTGSEFFPGGMLSYTIKAGSLKFEKGPTTDITLQWATYYDAADQAGQSRLWGGIHIQADDFTGRRIGAQCGKASWELAQRYFSGKGVG